MYRAIALGSVNAYGQLRDSADYETPQRLGRNLNEAVAVARARYNLGRLNDPSPQVVEISRGGPSYLIYRDAVVRQ